VGSCRASGRPQHAIILPRCLDFADCRRQMYPQCLEILRTRPDKNRREHRPPSQNSYHQVASTIIGFGLPGLSVCRVVPGKGTGCSLSGLGGEDWLERHGWKERRDRWRKVNNWTKGLDAGGQPEAVRKLSRLSVASIRTWHMKQRSRAPSFK
jgi:hypothetical protein